VGPDAFDKTVARDIARCLIDALDRDQDIGVRASAAYGLSAMGSKLVEAGTPADQTAGPDPLKPETLLAAFDAAIKQDPWNRLALVDAIERLGPIPSAAPSGLLQALEDPSSFVRGKAIQALSHFSGGVDPAVPVLLADLHDNTERFPPDYVGAAREIHPSPAVVPILIKALESDDGLVRQAAVILLTRVEPLPRSAAPALIASVKKALSVDERTESDQDSDEPANTKTQGLSPRSGTRPSQPAAGSISSDLANALAKAAPIEEAVPLLINVSKRKSPSTRRAAAEALGKFGPNAASAIPRLRELLEERDMTVRDAAKSALEEIDPQSIPRKRSATAE
jgi:HEAT repeat protein